MFPLTVHCLRIRVLLPVQTPTDLLALTPHVRILHRLHELPSQMFIIQLHADPSLTCFSG